MRTTILLSGVLLWTTSAFGQKVGDQILVTTGNAQLKSQHETVATIPRLSILEVKEVNGEWFKVAWAKSAKGKGWINRRDVIPVEKSLDFLNAEFRRNPTAAVYKARGIIWQSQKDHEKAIAEFNEAIRLKPSDSEAYFRRGWAWKNKGNFDNAVADLNEALRLTPNDPDVHSARGNVWSRLREVEKANRDYAEAVRLFTEALRRSPNDASLYLGRGAALFNKDEFQLAAADFNAVLRLEPQNETVVPLLAQAYFSWAEASQFYEEDKVIADYSEKIQANPNDAAAYLCRAYAWSQKHDHDRAIADYNEVINLDPKNAVAYHKRAGEWAEKGDLDNQIADLTESIRLYPKYVEVYVDRAEAYRQKGDFEKAISDSGQAIVLDPTHPAAHSLLAWLLATCPEDKHRDGKRAIELATKACELGGWKLGGWKMAANMDSLAAAYAEVGDFEKAVKWQKTVIENEDKADYQARLDLYKSGKPYRDKPSSTDYELDKPSSTDYELIEMVIVDLLDFDEFHLITDLDEEKSKVVLNEKTSRWYGFISDSQLSGEAYPKKDKLVPPDISADLRRRNHEEPFSLSGFKPNDPDIIVKDWSSLNRHDAEKKYPDARCFIETWLPGYSKDGKTAVVRLWFGPTAHGATATYLLVKQDGRWTVKWRKTVYYE